MVFVFATRRNMFYGPDYSPLYPDTIMNNTSLEAQGYSFEWIYLQYNLTPELSFVLWMFPNIWQTKWNVFKAAFALNISEMLSQQKFSLVWPNTVHPL